MSGIQFFGRSWRKRDTVVPAPIDVGKQTITALPISNFFSSPRQPRDDPRRAYRDGAGRDHRQPGRWEEFALHGGAGLPRDDLTRGDLKALPVQTAIHVGTPAANTAFAEAGRIIAAPDESAACPTDAAGTAARIADPALRR